MFMSICLTTIVLLCSSFVKACPHFTNPIHNHSFSPQEMRLACQTPNDTGCLALSLGSLIFPCQHAMLRIKPGNEPTDCPCTCTCSWPISNSLWYQINVPNFKIWTLFLAFDGEQRAQRSGTRTSISLVKVYSSRKSVCTLTYAMLYCRCNWWGRNSAVTEKSRTECFRQRGQKTAAKVSVVAWWLMDIPCELQNVLSDASLL